MAEDGSDATSQADSFYEWVITEHPDTANHWIKYDSESEFTDIIGAGGYSRDLQDNEPPGFSAGIVFGSGSPSWEYTVRISPFFVGEGGGEG